MPKIIGHGICTFLIESFLFNIFLERVIFNWFFLMPWIMYIIWLSGRENIEERLQSFMSRSRIYPIYVTGTGCRCDGDVCPCHASCCHAYIRAAVSHQIQRRVTRSGTRPTSTNTLHLHLTSSGWGERERGREAFLVTYQ